MHFCSRKLITLLVRTRRDVFYAGVAKLVDAPDLGSGAVRRGGSSPSTRTKNIHKKQILKRILPLSVPNVCQKY